jgi:hypothetical protein
MSDEDVFGQTFQRSGRLSPHVGATDQWLRVWRLIIGRHDGQGDFSVLSSEVPTGIGPSQHTYSAGLRIHFNISMMTAQTPNTAEITIYNLRDDYAKNLIVEGQYVTLEAGYQWGNAGAIFVGTIKMFKVGHETATDSYLKIYAGDGDKAFTEAVNNETAEIGTEARDLSRKIETKFEEKNVTTGYVERQAMKLPPLVREHVLFGQSAEQMRDFARANGAIWHILNEKFNFQGPASYQPGAVINLNAASGLIGFPEVTPDGITVTALINSAIRLRQRLRINNKYINQYFMPGGQSGGTYFQMGASFQFAPLSDDIIKRDGLYTPVQINYEGDSRGGPWYMTMTCLAVNEGASSSFLSVLNSVFSQI